MQTLYKFHAFFVILFVVIFILVLAAGDVTFATENTSWILEFFVEFLFGIWLVKVFNEDELLAKTATLFEIWLVSAGKILKGIRILTHKNFNPFSTNVPLLHPLFSGVIEVEHWLKMG